MFEVVFTESAWEDLRVLKKGAQNAVLDAIEQQLTTDPLTQTRNRKPLRPNDLSTWEMRVGTHRVFYDVAEDDRKVTVKAIGWKEHNKLFIRGKEYEL
jgi:mRNA-degrading endonuclease RelE of RelBE toxin-antitoxin system